MKKLTADFIHSVSIRLFLTLFLFCISMVCFAQDSTTKESIKKPSLVERLQKLGKEEAVRSIDKFVSEQKRLKQNELIRQLQTTIQNAKSYLKREFDTAAIQNELTKVEAWHDIASDGVFINTGTAQTHRNLTTTEKLINELHQRVADIKSRVDLHQNKLYRYQYQIDSLFSDSVLYEFPSDSAFTASYFQLLVHSAKELSPTDSALRKFIDRNEVLQYKVNAVLNKLSFSLDEINRYEAELFSNNFSRDFPNIWQSSAYHRPIREIIYNAKQKGTLTLGFYLQNHITRIIVCLLIIIAIAIFLTSLKNWWQNKTL